MPFKKIFITGSNRGLGKELVKLLHKHNPDVQIHISSRNQPHILAQQWRKEIPDHKFVCYQIDLGNTASIAHSVELIKKNHIKLDAIVANAAVGCDYGVTIPSQQVATSTLRTNVTATIDFVKQFTSVLSEHGRVVLVSSLMGSLEAQTEAVRQRLNDPSITQENILSFVEEYIQASIKQDMGTFNWSAYKTSKALLNAWGRFILPHYLKQTQTLVVLHPGWCQTDMGGKSAPLTSIDGANRIYEGLWLKQVQKNKFFNQKFCDYESCQ